MEKKWKKKNFRVYSKDKVVNKNVKDIFLSMCDVKVSLTFTSLSLVLFWQLFYLFYSSIVINTVIVSAENWLSISTPVLHHSHYYYLIVPSKNLDFQRHVSWSFLWSMNWSERWLFILLILMELLTITDMHFRSVSIPLGKTEQRQESLSLVRYLIAAGCQKQLHRSNIQSCWFCWYWWNYWLSLFKHSLHKSTWTLQIRVITKLPNSEQSYNGKDKTHNYINRQNQSTTGKLKVFLTFLFLTTYLYTFSLYENPSFIIFSAETEYI
jgi:hypothetical protein